MMTQRSLWLAVVVAVAACSSPTDATRTSAPVELLSGGNYQCGTTVETTDQALATVRRVLPHTAYASRVDVSSARSVSDANVCANLGVALARVFANGDAPPHIKPGMSIYAVDLGALRAVYVPGSASVVYSLYLFDTTDRFLMALELVA